MNRELAPNVINYLEAITQMRGTHKDLFYYGMEDLLLKQGQVFSVAKSLPRPIMRGQMRWCFGNSLAVARRLEKQGYFYTEGVALSRGLIPMHHAWLSRDGIAYDITWTEGVEYVGMTFPVSLVSLVLKVKGEYSVLDDWINGSPILLQPYSSAQLEEIYQKLLDKKKSKS
jgi:hypothetical protein